MILNEGMVAVNSLGRDCPKKDCPSKGCSTAFGRMRNGLIPVAACRGQAVSRGGYLIQMTSRTGRCEVSRLITVDDGQLPDLR